MTLLLTGRGLAITSKRPITASRLRDALTHCLDCNNVGYDRAVSVSEKTLPPRSGERLSRLFETNKAWGTICATVHGNHPVQGASKTRLYAPKTPYDTIGSIVIRDVIYEEDDGFYHSLLKASVETFKDLDIEEVQLITLTQNAQYLLDREWVPTRFAVQHGREIMIATPGSMQQQTYAPTRTFHECGQ